MQLRLQKIISQSGYCSRRKADELVSLGKVKVNGVVAKTGQSADPDKDEISIDGKRLKKAEFEYYIFNKPKYCLCTMMQGEREQGKKTIYNLPAIRQLKTRVYSVGRLDYDTDGLLILTNDGDFANEISHPSKEIKKTYLALINRPVHENDLAKLRKGIVIEGKRVIPDRLRMIQPDLAELTIHEGMTHVVKLLFEKIGYKVINLERIAIGNLTLGSLRLGQVKKVDKVLLSKLFS